MILDWDDTILPSSWLIDNNITLTNPQLSVDQDNALKLVQDALSVLLSTIQSLASCVIVTSASKEWIDLTANAFLPQLVPLIKHFRVVSARDKYALTFPDDP